MMALFPKELKERVRAFNPVKRFGSPEEEADFIGWLAGKRSNHVVGAAVVVDGGQLIMPASH
jgi:NAD(P)-dependent dehydrogenase (short-subunit alcohol dehydrogenase family)